MEPIRVPAPPKQSFNKHRRVSDLIRKQVHHFKHLEQKLPEHLRKNLPQQHVVTEEDAARYIAPMTQLLLSLNQQSSVTPITARKRPSSTKAPRIDIAASAEPKRNRAGKKAKPTKKSAAQPRNRKNA